MNAKTIPLNCLPLGRVGVVRELLAGAEQQRRLLDLGLVKGTAVEAVLKSPAGDPKAFQIRGALIALRNGEARQVLVGLQ